MCCRDERTKRVRAVYAPFIEICCAAYNTHTHHHHHTTHTPHHTTTPPPLSPIFFLSSLSPTFFIHTKENNRLPFDTKFFANLHDDRLSSKIGKIPTDDREKHNAHGDSSKQEKNGKQPDKNSFAEVEKKKTPIRRNTQKQRLQNSDQNWANNPGKKLLIENLA